MKLIYLRIAALAMLVTVILTAFHYGPLAALGMAFIQTTALAALAAPLHALGVTHITLPNETVAKTGFTDLVVIDFNDLVAKGATTSGVFTLSTYTARRYLYDKLAVYQIGAGFVGASVTNLTVKVGHNGGTTDDDDSLLEAIELATAGTEILSAAGFGAAFVTKATGYAPQDAGVIEATFTSTGANLSAMTAGKVAILFSRVDLAALCPSA
jgi:hypothetical protein